MHVCICIFSLSYILSKSFPNFQQASTALTNDVLLKDHAFSSVPVKFSCSTSSYFEISFYVLHPSIYLPLSHSIFLCRYSRFTIHFLAKVEIANISWVVGILGFEKEM